jgi:hypothetical protein
MYNVEGGEADQWSGTVLEVGRSSAPNPAPGPAGFESVATHQGGIFVSQKPRGHKFGRSVVRSALGLPIDLPRSVETARGGPRSGQDRSFDGQNRAGEVAKGGTEPNRFQTRLYEWSKIEDNPGALESFRMNDMMMD